jgi:hypothetical protein
MIHRDMFVAKVDGPGHVVGDLVGQIGMAKKCPTAEIDAANRLIQFWVMVARQHGAGNPIGHFGPLSSMAKIAYLR